jgi:hypothetical protein
MNRHEVHLLQQIRGYPALTITLPTHRAAPDNRQDPIRLKSLVKQATDRLLAEFDKRTIDPLLVQLEQLVAGVNFHHTLDGLALFVSPHFARTVALPFRLQERIVVDETFYTRDLVFAMNRTPRYWVLVLSEKPTRLLLGTRESLQEIENDDFPLRHTGPGGDRPLPGDFGINKSAYRDEKHRQFFRHVDAAFKPLLAADPLPVAVVGVERYLAFFREVSDHRGAILTTVAGSHDGTSPHDLGRLVWPHVETELAKGRERVFAELDRAIGERKLAAGPDEVWRLAQEGRGRLLVVEEDFQYPARVDDSGLVLTPADDATAPDVIDDAVDEIIEAVLLKQGQVVFVDPGRLADHRRIALILRY